MKIKFTPLPDIKPYLLVSSLFISLFFSSLSVKGQYYEDLNYGVKVGGVYSKISNMEEMLLSEDYFVGYSIKTKERYGGSFGVFLNYRFPDSYFAIQPEVAYIMQGGNVEFSNDKDLNWKAEFKYNYLNLTALFKAYPYEGFNIGIGPSLSMNLTSENIKYSSNESSSQQLNMQQDLRQALKGKTDFALVFGLGYEWEGGLSIDARYSFGLTDAIETQVNSNNFIENTNRSTVIQLTVGYALNFGNY